MQHIQIQSSDDLWYLSQIIEPNDKVTAKTERKIRIGGMESKETAKKTFTATINVTDIEFKEDRIRLQGLILDGPEDIPRMVHQAIDLEVGSDAKIEKVWKHYHLARLKEATQAKFTHILLCLLDREECLFAILKTQGYEILTHLKGEPKKKHDKAEKGKPFYPDIIKAMQEYDTRYKLQTIIVASPAFFKDELTSEIKDSKLKSKVVPAICNSVDVTGIDEVLKRPELKGILKNERSAKEAEILEELFKEISKDGKAAYGLKEVKNAVESGSAKNFIITDKTIKESRDKGKYDEIEYLMKLVDQAKGEIHILSSESAKKLQSLGGIACMLRYKVM